MRIFQLGKLGSIDGVVMAERSVPCPRAHEVLVRVRATSLNQRDLMAARGFPVGPELREGLIPLSDGAGEVVEVGPGVSRFKVGDRVAAIFRQGWIDGPFTSEGVAGDLGGGRDGMLAEYVVLNEDGLVSLPDHLSYAEGAALPCAAVTAWMAVVGKGNVRAGETVLVQGSGGVSLFALQFAKASGARVIATTSNEAKAQRLRALGADEVVDYRATPDWDREVLKLTGGLGADLVVEIGGVGTLARSLACTRVGGRVILVGLLTYGREDPSASAMFMSLFVRDISLGSVHVGSRSDFEAMNRAIAQNRLHPVIDRTFPFDRAREAYHYLDSGKHFGKVVIDHA